MEEPVAAGASKAQGLNERTFQEVDYLKKNLGPILVASLAEVCIRRPADPIEYLGHWLLRWRYNEELKRRDVQNTLEVVKQKSSGKDDEQTQASSLLQGFVPGSTNAPPGFGGPLDANALADVSALAGTQPTDDQTITKKSTDDGEMEPPPPGEEAAGPVEARKSESPVDEGKSAASRGSGGLDEPPPLEDNAEETAEPPALVDNPPEPPEEPADEPATAPSEAEDVAPPEPTDT